MQLFKRLLLSYFPDSGIKDTLNPASMFVSFISAKDFFNIIDRKIIENYKLNLFDVSVDVFEAKLGLGIHKDMLQSKLTDAYFSYTAAANFNGYKLYNVGNVSNALTLAVSMYLYDVFDDTEDVLFVDALYAFYLLSFLFEARIKVFPYVNDNEKNFQRFVDLYFNFYSVVISQLKHKITKKHFQELKTKILTQIEVFFLMFYYLQRVNNLLLSSSRANSFQTKDFYQRLFGNQLTPTQKMFFQSFETIIHTPEIGDVEQDLMFEFAPMDIHLKYLFLDNSVGEIVNSLVSNIYDRKILDQKLRGLMKNPGDLDFIMDYVTDSDNFKKGFFKGMKQYISRTRLQNQDGFDELDEMMSEIGDNIENLDQMQIPPSIKKESKTMEQMLNFYVTYVGGLSISRADTFFMRFYKPDLLTELMQYFDVHLKTPEAIDFYGLSHIIYTKNQAYYQYVNKKIHQGKEKFFIPATPIKTEPIKTSGFLLGTMDEIALMTLLQDCNPKKGKLYVKNKALLDWFQSQYSKEISSLIKLSDSDFVYKYYESIFSNFPLGENVLNILQNALKSQDVVRLKNSLYEFDVQLFREVLGIFPWKKFQKLYNDTVILHILALLRETLFGFLIYYQYLQLVQENQTTENLDATLIKKVYLMQVLCIDKSLYTPLSHMMDAILEQFGLPISLFMELDDNKEFFSMLKENRLEFLKKIDKKSEGEKLASFTEEDLLRLRGVFKHITYYNKRFLIPS